MCLKVSVSQREERRGISTGVICPLEECVRVFGSSILVGFCLMSLDRKVAHLAKRLIRGAGRSEKCPHLKRVRHVESPAPGDPVRCCYLCRLRARVKKVSTSLLHTCMRADFIRIKKNIFESERKLTSSLLTVMKSLI